MTTNKPITSTPFDWGGMVTFSEEAGGWICRDHTELHAACGKTKAEAEDNLRLALMREQKQ